MDLILEEFYEKARLFLSIKIEQCDKELAQLQEAKSTDTKSSMGDKYETSGEMLQQETARWLSIKGKNTIQLQQLDKIKYTYSPSKFIGLGTLFHTSEGFFYLGIALGKIQLNSQEVYALSVQSPLGQLFLGKKIRDVILFQSRSYTIISLFS